MAATSAIADNFAAATVEFTSSREITVDATPSVSATAIEAPANHEPSRIYDGAVLRGLLSIDGSEVFFIENSSNRASIESPRFWPPGRAAAVHRALIAQAFDHVRGGLAR